MVTEDGEERLENAMVGGVLSERRGGLWVRSISGTSGKQALNKKNGHFRDTRRLRSGQLKTNNKEEEFGNECRAAEKVRNPCTKQKSGTNMIPCLVYKQRPSWLQDWTLCRLKQRSYTKLHITSCGRQQGGHKGC
jgi:hypothetical protein